jgi:hypothetical protein
MTRLAKVAVAIIIGALLAGGVALADGDPASDVLLGENVFYPYSPSTSGPLQQKLNAETVAAAKAGFRIKVALIASPVDLGTIPELFGKPQKYADFLDIEISFQGKQKLLVVMAAGYGVQGLGPGATALAPKLAPPTGKSSDELAQAAITAVAKLAAADGHPLANFSASGASSSGGRGSGRTIVLIVLIVAAIATAGTLVAVRRRPASPRRARQ